MSRHTRYGLFDNGEGTVLNLTFDGVIAAKFYDDAGKKLLGTLCQYIGRTDKMFLDAASDYFRRFEMEYGAFRGAPSEDLLTELEEPSSPESVEGWRPITDDMPGDGTPLLLYARHPDATAFIRIVGWKKPDGSWMECTFFQPQTVIPLYWQSLPDWPASKWDDDHEAYEARYKHSSKDKGSAI